MASKKIKVVNETRKVPMVRANTGHLEVSMVGINICLARSRKMVYLVSIMELHYLIRKGCDFPITKIGQLEFQSKTFEDGRKLIVITPASVTEEFQFEIEVHWRLLMEELYYFFG